MSCVTIVPDVKWVSECFTLPNGEHLHVSVYLVQGPDGTVAIDSGSFVHRDGIRARIREAVGASARRTWAEARPSLRITYSFTSWGTWPSTAVVRKMDAGTFGSVAVAFTSSGLRCGQSRHLGYWLCWRVRQMAYETGCFSPGQTRRSTVP